MLYGKSPFLHENSNIMYGKIMEEEPVFPKDMKYSDDAIDLIKKLLKKTGSDRIGYDDEQEIFTHPWFNDIDFAKLIAKKLPPMVIPHVDESPIHRDRPISEIGFDAIVPLKKNIELSFEIEDEKRKKAIANLPPGTKLQESFEDFSYFEEEDHVETAIDDFEGNILDEDFEMERRIQLLTNIEECSDENIDTRDALKSPPNETTSAPQKPHKSVEVEDKFLKRKSSVDTLDTVSKNSEKIDRKGSDQKPSLSTQKRPDSLEMNKGTQVSPISGKREFTNRPQAACLLDLVRSGSQIIEAPAIVPETPAKPSP